MPIAGGDRPDNPLVGRQQWKTVPVTAGMKNRSWSTGEEGAGVVRRARDRLRDAFAEAAFPVPWSGGLSWASVFRLAGISIALAPVALAVHLVETLRVNVARLAQLLTMRAMSW